MTDLMKRANMRAYLMTERSPEDRERCDNCASFIYAGEPCVDLETRICGSHILCAGCICAMAEAMRARHTATIVVTASGATLGDGRAS